jgi:hypothetical protein
MADDSVMIALAELRDLESARIRDAERKRAAEAAAEQARRDEIARAERHAAEHRAHVASEEARLRLDAEWRARDEDAERRIQTMRSELAAMRAERELIHHRLTAAAAPYDVPRSRSARGAALGLVSTVIGAAVIGLAFWAGQENARGTTTAGAAPTLTADIPSDVPHTEAVVTTTPNTEASEPTPTSAQEAERPTAPTTTQGRERPRDPRPPRPPREHTAASELELEDCGDDPICGTTMEP